MYRDWLVNVLIREGYFSKQSYDVVLSLNWRELGMGDIMVVVFDSEARLGRVELLEQVEGRVAYCTPFAS